MVEKGEGASRRRRRRIMKTKEAIERGGNTNQCPFPSSAVNGAPLACSPLEGMSVMHAEPSGLVVSAPFLWTRRITFSVSWFITSCIRTYWALRIAYWGLILDEAASAAVCWWEVSEFWGGVTNLGRGWQWQ